LAFLPDISDDDLLTRYRAGDARAFDTLFERHYVSVYNFACVLLRNEADAEDVLQDTFLAVAKHADSYEATGKFKPWLMRIVRNRCFNRLETRRSRQERFVPLGLALVEPDSLTPGPPDAAILSEQLRLVREGITELPERQREALCLYAFEHMPYREIAAVLNVPMNTVKTLIRRARIALAKRVMSAEKEPDDVV